MNNKQLCVMASVATIMLSIFVVIISVYTYPAEAAGVIVDQVITKDVPDMMGDQKIYTYASIQEEQGFFPVMYVNKDVVSGDTLYKIPASIGGEQIILTSLERRQERHKYLVKSALITSFCASLCGIAVALMVKYNDSLKKISKILSLD